MSESLEAEPTAVRENEALQSISAGMQRLAKLVAQDREITNTSSYKRIFVPGVGRLSWLQVYHELHVRVGQQRTEQSTLGVEIDQLFDITADDCLPKVDANATSFKQDRAFKFSMRDADTSQLQMFWIDQSDGFLTANSYDDGIKLPPEELEAYARLPEAIYAAAPAILEQQNKH